MRLLLISCMCEMRR